MTAIGENFRTLPHEDCHGGHDVKGANELAEEKDRSIGDHCAAVSLAHPRGSSSTLNTAAVFIHLEQTVIQNRNQTQGQKGQGIGDHCAAGSLAHSRSSTIVSTEGTAAVLVYRWVPLNSKQATE